MKTYLTAAITLIVLTTGTSGAQQEDDTPVDDTPVKEAAISPSAITYEIGGTTVLAYQPAPVQGDERWQSNYLHPLLAPSGIVITEHEPEDHIHHRGIWLGWRRMLVDGQDIGDSWDGRHFFAHTKYLGDASAAGTGTSLRFRSNWFTDIAGPPMPFLSDETTVTATEADNTRTVIITTSLTALTPGLQLGGTDDEKGYGGMSFRFAHPDKMDIESDGESLTATSAAVKTGETVTFLWDGQGTDVPPDWPQEISVACTVDGEPWTNWVLRQELSMQNCAWPGNTMADIPMDEPVVIEATITIRQ
ncbi:hypothetical protein FF098_017010 [Parvularcula flava]|uniref:Methane monooxygenase PmoA-like n=1 Tax=Aquisalinus luteolus TaxID=1566827 RepID=A0A8J3AAV3_9PROT|nr:DUF6807 family protein [Aquisalinus luteolus]NHK29610.1 hypothetical protein [Aquisalinus luteolus]GGI01417.1 hypothetical protein GCM10011355_32010 [Aquisalinus luteolus]